MSCATPEPAFCDTFAAPSPGGRGGDLDETKWSFARVTQAVNVGQGQLNWWVPTHAQFCKTTIAGIVPDQDSFMCGSQFGEPQHWMEALNDATSYAYVSAMARQRFDFANRTGHIVWDVDAKTALDHGWWPELWLTDEPLPAPHTANPGTKAFPRNGLGLIFHDDCQSNGTQGNLSEIAVFQNYRQVASLRPTAGQGSGPFQLANGCYTTQNDGFNHFEVRLSQQRLELWASDFSPDHMTFPNFQLRAWVDGLNLPFTQGYVHWQHTQYNAAKDGHAPEQTYHWGNLGFDGPQLPMDRGYSVPDALTPGGHQDEAPGAVNTGYEVTNTGITTLSNSGSSVVPSLLLPNVDLSQASSARLMLNLMGFTSGSVVNYRFNHGTWRSYAHPFLESTCCEWRTISIPVPLGDLQSGTNTLDLQEGGTADGLAAANIDLEVIH